MKGQVLKMVSFNCQGLNTKEKRGDVLNYLYSKDYNIYCLQDIHFVEQDEVQIKNQWQGECIFNSFASNQRGVAIFFKNNFEFKINQVKKDDNGNLLGLDLNIEDKRITLINIYGSNVDTPCFYNKVAEVIENFDIQSCIYVEILI